jgi:hypothetical protein
MFHYSQVFIYITMTYKPPNYDPSPAPSPASHCSWGGSRVLAADNDEEEGEEGAWCDTTRRMDAPTMTTHPGWWGHAPLPRILCGEGIF